MSEQEHHESHGHSTAAWTGVAVILVGTALMSWAVLDPNLVLFIIGTVISVLGAVAAKVLSLAGYGDQVRLAEKARYAERMQGARTGGGEHSSGIS